MCDSKHGDLDLDHVSDVEHENEQQNYVIGCDDLDNPTENGAKNCNQNGVINQAATEDTVLEVSECSSIWEISEPDKNQQSKEDERTFQCNFCEKKFNRMDDVRCHYIVHTDERPHVCIICHKAYRHRSALYKHKRTHKPPEPPKYPCEICGKYFKLKSYLNIHTVIHTSERPFGCEMCGKTFKDRSARNKHVKAHLGIKPFTCEMCGKCFGRRGDYKSHLIVHTGERPYTCSVCGQSFRSSSNCHRHSRSHTNDYPYKCDECDKAFNQSWKLKEHKFVHSKVLPFICDQCGVGFRYSRRLKQHVENHARERLHNQVLNLVQGNENSAFEVVDIKPDISALLGE